MEINKLIEQKNYEIVINKIEGLLKEFRNEYILFEDLSKIYLDVLEKRIEVKKKEGEKNIIELEKFKNFIEDNKDALDDEYKEKLRILEFNKVVPKQEEIEIDNVFPLINKNNYKSK